nr:unnamed protein product [Callosobruchus analis]
MYEKKRNRKVANTYDYDHLQQLNFKYSVINFDVLDLVFKPCVDLILCVDFNVDPVRDEKLHIVRLTFNDLFKEKWDEVCTALNLNASFNTFYDIFYYYSSLPLKEIYLRHNKTWIDDKRLLYYLSKNFPELHKHYQQRKHEQLLLVEHSKLAYYDKKINFLVKLAKNAWSLSIIGENNIIHDYSWSYRNILLTPFVKAEFFHLTERKTKLKASSGFDEIPVSS